MKQKVYPVDVISLCSADGEIQPLRLRVECEDKQRIRIDIVQILQTKEIPYVGAEARIYYCRGLIGQVECSLELKYTIRTHVWTMTQ